MLPGLKVEEGGSRRFHCVGGNACGEFCGEASQIVLEGKQAVTCRFRLGRLESRDHTASLPYPVTCVFEISAITGHS